ncbi:MAG: hypothetical protein AAFW89_07050 [Bacteroidota bacterium]
MKRIYSLTVLLLVAFIVHAQGPDGSVPQGENLEIPTGWTVRFDQTAKPFTLSNTPDSGDVYFVNMTPGWHITTGPAGIFYHEKNVAENEYMLSATLYLFDTKGRNREAFGLFLGGKNLEKESQSYLYFLVRNTGEYLIKVREGENTRVIQPWTKTEHMNLFEGDDPEQAAENTVQAERRDNELHFYINNQLLTTIPAGDYDTDGYYGFRVNHSLNLHCSILSMQPVES